MQPQMLQVGHVGHSFLKRPQHVRSLACDAVVHPIDSAPLPFTNLVVTEIAAFL